MQNEQFLKITDVSIQFLLREDPEEILYKPLLNINLSRVLLNLLNSLGTFFHRETKNTKIKANALKKFLFQEENKKIISNFIWLSIIENNFKKDLELSKKDKFHQKNYLLRKIINLQNKLYQKVSQLYIHLMNKESIIFKRIIEKIYFDIIAQAVFYSLFYAFPKSRIDFDYQFRYFLFELMSEFFTGIKISPVSKFSQHWNFVDDWYLDLGAGNVLSKNIYNKKSIDKEFKNKIKRGTFNLQNLDTLK